jgi:ubiquinone/menaquinone biosynthesis C-methylase UbiE
MSDSREHASRNAAKFDAWAPTFEDKRFDFFRRMQKRVLDMVDLRKGAAFLDIGCGTGWAVRTAAEIVGPGGSAHGIDLSPRMIQEAKQAAHGIGNAHFQTANAEDLPFARNSFDSIICTMSFHHYLDPQKAVREMARVLKPGGKVCIVDPTADFFGVKWAGKLIKRMEPEHVGMYSSREFGRFFEGAGLRSIESKRPMFLWFTAKAHIAMR